MKKRFLALTIAVLMALCVIPFTASAELRYLIPFQVCSRQTDLIRVR